MSPRSHVKWGTQRSAPWHRNYRQNHLLRSAKPGRAAKTVRRHQNAAVNPLLKRKTQKARKPNPTPAFKVTANDVVLFDNKPVARREPPRVWRYHKPEGLVTSHKDEEGRATVFQNLPKDLPRVISVGRLDITSEGLLLLTNDGSVSRALELPKTGFIRRYRARAYGSVNQDILDTLKAGIKIDGVPTGPIEATLDKVQGGNVWITVTIKEGKNREVRRALDEVGLTVNRLIRTSYGPFQLGKLGKGQVEEVPNDSLREMIGHLVDIPKTAPMPEASAFKGKPKRGSHASAKRFQKPSAASAERHDGTAKPQNRTSKHKTKSGPSSVCSWKPSPKRAAPFATILIK